MKRKKLLILLSVIIVLAVISFIAYFKFFKGRFEDKDMSFETSQSSTLPIIRAKIDNKEINAMYPYRNKVSDNVTNETLNVLPADGQFKFEVKNNKKTVKSMSYEIRNMAGELIDSKVLEEIKDKTGDFEVLLPIQSQVLQGNEYNLKLRLDIEKEDDEILAETKEDEQKSTESLYYYSRVRAFDSDLFLQMINLADDFSIRNFDYDAARENTTYLETDGSISAPMLCDISLKSSFDMLTYNALKIKPLEQRDIRLVSYDGNVGEVHIISYARRKNDLEEELYEIEESFIFRKGEERLYMLDYHRGMKEIFNGEKHNFTGTRLSLGITSDKDISSIISEDKKNVVFISAKDLFIFDNKENILRKIFSARDMSSISSTHLKYDVKILSITNEKLNFLVYGYINSGKYEGRLGSLIYEYDIASQKLKNLAFIEDFSSYDELKADTQRLAYLNKNNVFYMKKARSVYSIDLNNNATKVEIAIVEDKSFTASESGQFIAYKDASGKLYYRNLESGESKTVEPAENERILIEGFVDSDLVVGISKPDEDYSIHGQTHEAKLREIRILNKDLELLKNYISPDKYLSDVLVESDIIKFNIYTKDGNGAYKLETGDSIVSSTGKERKDGVGYYASETKTRVYYIQTPKNFAVNKTKVTGIKKFNMLDNTEYSPVENNRSSEYLVFANGSYMCSYTNISEAVKKAYENMGSVLYNGRIVYFRAATLMAHSGEIDKNEVREYIEARQNGSILSLFGIELNQALYYVSKGFKVLTYNSSGEALIIYAYDRYNISVYDVASERTYKIGRGDATADFLLSYNDFSTILKFN